MTKEQGGAVRATVFTLSSGITSSAIRRMRPGSAWVFISYRLSAYTASLGGTGGKGRPPGRRSLI